MEVRKFISENTSDKLGENAVQERNQHIIRCWDAAYGYEEPHRFKKHEWNCTKKELIEGLVTFYQDVLIPSRTAPFQEYNYISDWWPNDIDHFLSCMFHLIRGPIHLHHIRCCVTLIRQGAVRRSIDRLGGLTK